MSRNQLIRGLTVLISIVVAIGFAIVLILQSPESVVGSSLASAFEVRLSDVISLSPTLTAILAILALYVSMFTNGLEHALYYSRANRMRYTLHEPDLFQEWAYYAFPILLNLPFSLVLGAALSGRLLFQGPINYALTGRILDERKPSGGLRFFGVRLPRFFEGPLRLVQAGIGVVLILLSLPL
jgi:hypothetical protein